MRSFSDVGQEKRNALSIRNRWRSSLSRRAIVILFTSATAVIVCALALGLGLGLGLHHSPNSTPTNPIVDLGYAKYQGSNSTGISRWLGMRYAAIPTGHLRFAAPAPPPREKGVQQAIKHGSRCLGIRLNTTSNPSSPGQSEDCLYIEVYAPGNATARSKLPVYVYLQGGGFVQNDGTYDASSLIKASGMQIVVVNLNYRVGPYGFLASEEVRKGGSLNNGLKDQRFALHWVQEHISKFGGNPSHVVLGGSSAGAASITLQLIAYGARNDSDSLFHAVAAESQSFGALRTVPESQYQYDELVARIGCSLARDTLSCLRKLSTAALQGQNIGTPFPNTTQLPLFAYNPTLDFDFVPDYTLSCFAAGKFLKVPAIYGDATDEGTVFAPRSLNSTEASNEWLRAQFPALNASQQNWIQRSYHPPSASFRTPPNYTVETGTYWNSTASAYGELRYICPGLFLSNIYTAYGIRNWNYRYAVLDPRDARAGLGTPHVAELNAIWGAPANAPESYRTGGMNRGVVGTVQGYWVRFIRGLDPNFGAEEGKDVRWEEWSGKGFGEKEGGRRILFRGNGTVMEGVGKEQWERCKVMSGWGRGLGQ
ncbi:MAG: hypothetical protein Q9220_001841 [cf. Caloplaca sp. 1 TL-2023]